MLWLSYLVMNPFLLYLHDSMMEHYTVNNVLSGIQYIDMKKKSFQNQSHRGVVVSKSDS